MLTPSTPPTLDYQPAPRRKLMLRVEYKFALVGIICWILGNFVPYMIVGEYWGYVWYPMNHLFGAYEWLRMILPQRYLFVMVVTFSNGILTGICLALLSYLVRVWCTKHPK